MNLWQIERRKFWTINSIWLRHFNNQRELQKLLCPRYKSWRAFPYSPKKGYPKLPCCTQGLKFVSSGGLVTRMKVRLVERKRKRIRRESWKKLCYMWEEIIDKKQQIRNSMMSRSFQSKLVLVWCSWQWRKMSNGGSSCHSEKWRNLFTTSLSY